jgi:hypothetical protein
MSSFATWSVLRLEPATPSANSSGVRPIQLGAAGHGEANPIVKEPLKPSPTAESADGDADRRVG